MAKDVTTSLAWAAEPELEERHRTGVKVIIYLVLLTTLVYLSMKKIWSRLLKYKHLHLYNIIFSSILNFPFSCTSALPNFIKSSHVIASARIKFFSKSYELHLLLSELAYFSLLSKLYFLLVLT